MTLRHNDPRWAVTAGIIVVAVTFLMGDDCDPPATAVAEPCHDEILTLADKSGAAKCSHPDAKGTQVSSGNTIAILCSCPGRK